MFNTVGHLFVNKYEIITMELYEKLIFGNVEGAEWRTLGFNIGISSLIKAQNGSSIVSDIPNP